MHFEFCCLYTSFSIYFLTYFVYTIIVNRRVHITEETLQHLNGAYQVEDGDGGSRDPLLTGRKTYLVIDPHKPDSISRRPKLVGVHICEVHAGVFRKLLWCLICAHFQVCAEKDTVCYLYRIIYLFNWTCASENETLWKKNNSNGISIVLNWQAEILSLRLNNLSMQLPDRDCICVQGEAG